MYEEKTTFKYLNWSISLEMLLNCTLWLYLIKFTSYITHYFKSISSWIFGITYKHIVVYNIITNKMLITP